jgi:hypothetical protein
MSYKVSYKELSREQQLIMRLFGDLEAELLSELELFDTVGYELVNAVEAYAHELLELGIIDASIFDATMAVVASANQRIEDNG